MSYIYIYIYMPRLTLREYSAVMSHNTRTSCGCDDVTRLLLPEFQCAEVRLRHIHVNKESIQFFQKEKKKNL